MTALRKKITDSLFCLWDCKNREAGSGEINGKMRSWDAAYQLIGVPVESSSARLWKYPVAPEKVQEISSKLNSVYWGTLIQLTFSGKYVVDIEVLCDWLGQYYEEN